MATWNMGSISLSTNLCLLQQRIHFSQVSGDRPSKRGQLASHRRQGKSSNGSLFLSLVGDGDEGGEGIQRGGKREDRVCPNLQIYPQLQLLCLRDRQIREEEKNSRMFRIFHFLLSLDNSSFTMKILDISLSLSLSLSLFYEQVRSDSMA